MHFKWIHDPQSHIFKYVDEIDTFRICPLSYQEIETFTKKSEKEVTRYAATLNLARLFTLNSYIAR